MPAHTYEKPTVHTANVGNGYIRSEYKNSSPRIMAARMYACPTKGDHCRGRRLGDPFKNYSTLTINFLIINIHRPSRWFFFDGHSPLFFADALTRNTVCQPRRIVTCRP